MKVALFTSFGPNVGGGAAYLRSLVAHMEGIEVTWFHLGPPLPDRPACVSLGPSIVGGPIVPDLLRTSALWLGAGRWMVGRLAEQIRAARCDRHWVVAMDEGIPLGLCLARRAPGIPLHVSIHDDQEHGMYGRSRRYRAIARLARAPMQRLLRGARSVDVVGEEMQTYYRDRCGVSTSVVRPVVALPVPTAAAQRVGRDARRLTVGHIGAIYSPAELATMLEALKRAAATRRLEPAAIFIGLLPRYRPLVEQAGLAAELPVHLAEPDAVPVLARCDFVYAMYPFNRASEVFRRTSLPTKLTTYVQAGRPILAHAPADSTLARTIGRFGVGAVCTENTVAALEHAIAAVVADEIPAGRFAAWHEAFYGIDNAQRLAALLRHGAADA